MKTITLKPEFEKKLKGVKRKFVKNLVANYGYDGAMRFVQEMQDWPFDAFLYAAFVFNKTPEKFDFWYKIANR